MCVGFLFWCVYGKYLRCVCKIHDFKNTEKVRYRRFVICCQIHIIFCIDEIITLISH